VCWRDPRFIGFRSAGEIGIDVFFWESHELLLLSEEIVEIDIHRYVHNIHKGEGERWWCMYKGRRDASDLKLTKVVHIKGPREELTVTLLAWLGKYCLAGLGKFNIDVIQLLPRLTQGWG
jgi:hypothetical protein